MNVPFMYMHYAIVSNPMNMMKMGYHHNSRYAECFAISQVSSDSFCFQVGALELDLLSYA